MIAWVTVGLSLWVSVAVQGECVSTALLVISSELKLCAPLMETVAPSTMMSCRVICECGSECERRLKTHARKWIRWVTRGDK